MLASRISFIKSALTGTTTLQVKANPQANTAGLRTSWNLIATAL
jgi:hypothetical protein